MAEHLGANPYLRQDISRLRLPKIRGTASGAGRWRIRA